MDQDPKSEAQAEETLQKLKETPADRHERPDQVVSWLINSTNRYGNLFTSVSPILSEMLLKNSLDVGSTLDILDFYKKHSQKCKGDCAPQFVIVGLVANVQCHERVATASESLMTAIRPSIYLHPNTLTNIIEAIREVVIPKMKSLAEAKSYREALAIWRSIVRFTHFEKIPTSVTNKILHVASMAFKEINSETQIDAFHSWKIFIESLPESTVKKSNYVALLLNPLNRVYRDTDSETNPHKFSVWWQLVRSLRSHAENHFDQVVVPLIQKLFNLSRHHTKSTTDAVHMNRNVSQEAYAIFALLLYMGNNEILKEMNGLHEKLPVNQHVFKDEHFVKHCALVQEALDIIMANILGDTSPSLPPKVYPYLLLKILISRASSLYLMPSADLSRAFVGCAMKLLRKTPLDAEQSLGIFSDLANGTPQKLMMSPNFIVEFPGTPIAHLTVFFINRMSAVCSQGTENQRKRFRSLLRVLLERASSDFLAYTDHVITNFGEVASSLGIPIWSELAERLAENIAHTHEVNQGSDSEPNFNAIIKTLQYPFKKASFLTVDTVKLWSKLFTVFAANAVLVKNVAQNQAIEEVCRALLDDLRLAELSLHRLLLHSRALDSVVRQISPVTVEDKKRPLGNLDSLVKCLSFIGRESFQYISDVKQPRGDCQFFVNFVTLSYHLLHTVEDTQLFKELCNALLPDLLPLYESTKSRNIIRETCLNQVEAPLTSILGQLSEELVSKASSIDDDSEFARNIRSVLNVATGHWKRSIRDAFVAYANSISMPVGDGDQSSQSLSQYVSVSDAVPIIVSKAPVAQEKEAAVTKRRSSRKAAKPIENEDFTPIKSAKKKSIFTEHQLEKQAESKVIPSMYQDLSQSVDKKPTLSTVQSGPSATIASSAPVVDEDANFDVDFKPKKDEEEPDEYGLSNGKPVNAGPDQEPLAETTSGNLEIEGIRPIESPEEVEAALPPVAESVNNENDEPLAKKKKRFSYNENEDLLDAVAIDQQPSSLMKMAEKIQHQQLLDRGEIEAAVSESPMRNFVPRKRKIGQNFESPVLSRMPPKNTFLVHSPSSRSRRMLEAAQAKQTCQTDMRHMLAGSTPRQNNFFPIFDNPPQTQVSSTDERRMTVAAANGVGGSMSSPPSTRRSILKRFSTGASVKRVSFSRSNEVCPFFKNRTSKSLFPPFTVNDDEENATGTGENEASAKVNLCEKSFHEDPEEASEFAENGDDTNVSSYHSANNSVRLELSIDDDSPEGKVQFETGGCDRGSRTGPDIAGAGIGADNEKFSDALTDAPSGLEPSEVSEEIATSGPSSAEIGGGAAQPTPELNLVDLIKSADGDQRKQMLAHVSSIEFLAKMTADERNAFAIRVFTNIGSYVQ